MNKTRVGVIGAGSWAVAAHLPALAARDDVELVAVCRHGADMLGRIKDRFGFAYASQDWQDVVAHQLDAIVVSSPSAVHHEQAKAALESGAHVLCEKPMTIDPAKAWDLVDTASRVERQLLVSFGWNYMPIVRDAVALLERHGGIGDLEHMSIHMSSATRELLSNTGAYPDASAETVPEQSTWTDPSISGGGYGQAQLSHALGLALHLVPERVRSVYALTENRLGSPVELHDAVVLRFDGGGIGTLSGGSNHLGAWGNKHELEVRAIGSAGQLIVDVHRDLVWLFRPGEVDERLELAPGAGDYVMSGPANALIDVARGDTSGNSATGELGARTVETLDLLYRSARSGVLETRGD